jgi:hypothetical protein
VDAEIEHKAVFAARKTILGPTNPDTLMSQFNTALSVAQRDQKEGLSLAQEALEASTKALGPGNSITKQCQKLLDMINQKPLNSR